MLSANGNPAPGDGWAADYAQPKTPDASADCDFCEFGANAASVDPAETAG